MKSDKRLKFRVVSTAGHNKLCVSRKEADRYIKQLYKEKRVGVYTEFRVFEVGNG